MAGSGQAAPIDPIHQIEWKSSMERANLGRCDPAHGNQEPPMSSDDPKRPTGSTTGSGAPAASDRNSLTIGPDGPILLHDVHFLEQMAHFNREKVPERQPHAKGAGAFGVFETTADVSRY